jgi:hypothetical protein
LALIITLFVGMGLWYSLAVPAYETPDELYHYPFARHLAQGNPLPVQGVEATGPWNQEGSQAPLYYWIVGRLTAPIDQSDFEQLAITNCQNQRFLGLLLGRIGQEETALGLLRALNCLDQNAVAEGANVGLRGGCSFRHISMSS